MANNDGYTIVRTISQARVFSIFQAIRDSDNQSVLLKKCNIERFENFISLQHEYQILAHLDNPNILRAHNLINQGNQCFLELEYFDGLPLQQYLQKEPLTLSKFIKIALNIIDALHELHVKQIIHKKINPNSIFIDAKSMEVKLTDFSLASQQTQEGFLPYQLKNMDDILAYISPEQTTRMKHVIDHRTDFYSLGMTFYLMLTGKLPFDTNDPMEMIHNHMAKMPAPISTINSQIPQQITNIVNKLMAKMPDERYASTTGLKLDLINCQTQWINNHNIDLFQLALNDVYDYLILSQKLYGRELQIQQLEDSFKRVAHGDTECLIISGYSGIGKSSLVKELYKTITNQNGYFLSGKYDQLQRAKPYSAIVEAFQNLINYLLNEPKENLQVIKQKLLESLGANGQVIVDVIPNIVLIIGEQPPVAELTPIDAQNRFLAILQKFVRALAHSDHPFVLFLDDLQWIDSASLGLITTLMSDTELHHFLLLGAYRDNEVGDDHILYIALNHIANLDIKFRQIKLTSLQFVDIQNLLADSFKSTLIQVESLAELLLKKTYGNPFFINQYLKLLYQNKLLLFYNEKKQWLWDISHIQAQSISENVVDLLTFRIRQLPEETQNLLQLATCIGHTFDLRTLSIISGKNISDILHWLSVAISLNLIAPIEIVTNHPKARKFIIRYKFSHDRIQQAAYNLVEEEKKEHLHLRIGELLLKQNTLYGDEDNLFEIVDHFVQGLKQIKNIESKNEISQYLLRAGKKAKDSTAFQAAKNYFNAGVFLLQPIDWKKASHLTFNLYKELSVSQYLTGEFEKAKDNFSLIIRESKNPIATMEYYKLYCEMLATLNYHNEAIKQGLKALKLFGINLPTKPNTLTILNSILKIELRLRLRKVQDINLKPISNEKYGAVINIISQLFNSAFIINQDLFLLLACTNIHLSLKFGYTDSTSFASLVYAFASMHALHRYREGLNFVELHNKITRFQTLSNFTGKNYFVLGAFIDPYRYPIETTFNTLTKAYQHTSDVGDLAYSNYTNILLMIAAHIAGKPLSTVEKYMRTALSFMDKVKISDFRNLVLFYYYSLQCITSTAFSMDDLNDFKNKIVADQNTTENAFFYSHATKLLYLLNRFDEAQEYGELHEKYKDYALGMLSTLDGCLYYALSIMASVKSKKELSFSKRLVLKKIFTRVARWTKWNPSNFEHFLLLLKAEESRLDNNQMQAIKLYNQTITLCHKHQVINFLAITNECAGRFYASLDIFDIAQAYFKKAYFSYQEWGANYKCVLFLQNYPEFFISPSVLKHKEDALSLSEKININSIDVASILKAAQAIGGEIQLDKLLKKLIYILLQNAGAQHGLLLYKDELSWYVAVEGNIDSQTVYLNKNFPIEKRDDLPLKLIQHIQEVNKLISIQNVNELKPYLKIDEYLKKNKPQSLLILPVYFQAQLRYILYLENRDISHAFTPNNIEMVRLLASQASIALENAYLYHQVTHDPLTGLANRNLLYQKFNAAVETAQNTGKKIALIFLDIDNFKHINDTLGHEVGDNILIYFSKLLLPVLREGDVAARLGGDEFTIMIQNIDDASQINVIVDRFMIKLNELANIMEHEVFISASVGISIYPNDADNIQELLKLADISLYQVKATGKGRYEYYTSYLHQKLLDENAKEILIRVALENDEFQLYYQPIVKCHNHSLVHFEALLRWKHPSYGIIAAGEFIPLAEKTGLILPIGEWVLRIVCKQLMDWKKQGLPVYPIAINISGLQFQSRLGDMVESIINETGIDPNFLELEFTESVFIDQSDKLMNSIAEFKKLNIKLILDDFGTHYSSLSYLKRLPIDAIKIDRSFISDINKDKDSNSIIQAIIAMGHSLNLKVIGEGVETEEQIEFLERNNIDELQGYLFAKPLNFIESTDYLLALKTTLEKY